MKDAAFCVWNASTNSGDFEFNSFWLREYRLTPEALRNTKHRTTSSLGSNSQPFRENRSSVRVASIGTNQSGCFAFRTFARASGGKRSGKLSSDTYFKRAISI